MRIYLDMCCLKRPFDDQSQERVKLESASVLALLAAAGPSLEIIRTRAHDLENDQNPNHARADRVRGWLERSKPIELPEDELIRRTGELLGLGFKGFDAFHIASAEAAQADVLATCDDGLLSTAGRNASRLHVRLVNPVALAAEVLA